MNEPKKGMGEGEEKRIKNEKEKKQRCSIIRSIACKTETRMLQPHFAGG